MIVSSLDLFRHELIGIVLLGLMSEVWVQGQELKQFERRWARFVARQWREQAKVERTGLPGLAHQPHWVECQTGTTSAEVPSPPPPGTRSKRGRRREVKPTWQFCPDEKGLYYGWPGLGNLTSTGHANSSPWRLAVRCRWRCC